MSSVEPIHQNEFDGGDTWSYAVVTDPSTEAMQDERVLSEQRARVRRARARRRRRAQIRRRRLTVLVMIGLVLFGMWSIVGAITSPSGRATTRHAVTVSWNQFTGPSARVPGRLATLTWPDKGEAAVGIQGAGVIAHSPGQRVVPIASMTKMMTAILILRDHPLRPGEAGPMISLTAADAQAWVVDSQNGDSVVPVRAGERLSEFQLLEALLMSSGDNIADILARWDARSIGAFVRKMNENARALSLSHTTYADPSGVSAASRSTPSEQIIVAGQLMKSPIARLIVDQKSIAFPVAGTIPNFNPALGVDGIIGVKSGFTHAAMGCLAVATMRTVGNHSVMLIAVSTGNLFGLYGAARVDEQLLSQAQSDLVTVTPIHANSILANIELQGSMTPTPLRLMRRPPTFVVWRGAHLRSKVLINPLATPSSQGRIGLLVYSTPTGTLGSVPLAIAPPSATASGTAAS